jgi:hypothetical protein
MAGGQVGSNGKKTANNFAQRARSLQHPGAGPSGGINQTAFQTSGAFTSNTINSTTVNSYKLGSKHSQGPTTALPQNNPQHRNMGNFQALEALHARKYANPSSSYVSESWTFFTFLRPPKQQPRSGHRSLAAHADATATESPSKNDSRHSWQFRSKCRDRF